MPRYLPALSFNPLRTLQSGEPSGKWHITDKWRDGEISRWEGVWRAVYNGAQSPNNEGIYNENATKSPLTGWRPIPGGISGPNSPQGYVEAGYGAENVDNIDTHTLTRNPRLGTYTAFLSNKPGTRPGEPASGYIASVQRVTTPAAGPEAIWTNYPGEHVLEADETNAPWTYPIDESPSNPNYRGGILEQSAVIEPRGTIVHPNEQVLVFFFTGSRTGETPATWYPSAGGRRWRIGRAEVPVRLMDDVPFPAAVWTPAKAADSYVWSPDEPTKNGLGKYGVTNETATPGTRHGPLQSHVSRAPDGVYWMVMLNATPNTAGNTENASGAVFAYYSLDQGYTWHANRSVRPGEPPGRILTYPDMGWGEYNGIAEKLNSPHICWLSAYHAWLFVWGNNAGMGEEDTQCYAFEMRWPQPGGRSGFDPFKVRM